MCPYYLDGDLSHAVKHGSVIPSFPWLGTVQLSRSAESSEAQSRRRAGCFAGCLPARRPVEGAVASRQGPVSQNSTACGRPEGRSPSPVDMLGASQA